MTQSGTAVSDGAAGEVSQEELVEAKRAARRIERNAHGIVKDLAHLTELLPSLGIRVTFESTLGSEGHTDSERKVRTP